MWKIPILSKILLERKERRIAIEDLKTRVIDASKIDNGIRRITLQEWKDSMKQVGENIIGEIQDGDRKQVSKRIHDTEKEGRI